jgi:hypothetical protein
LKKIMALLFSALLVSTVTSGTANAAGFSDVKTGDHFYDEMMYLNGKKVIQGYANNRFLPGKNVTRGEALLIITRTLGLQPKNTNDAIRLATEKGFIVKNGVPRPNDPVKRSDMALYLSKAFSMTDEELPFTDMNVSDNPEVYSAIRKIRAAGVTNGLSNGTFKQNDNVSRADFSGFIARATNDKYRLPVNVCGYNNKSRVNPDRQTINCLLTQAAQKANIPPEILKAVASVEKNDWQHFKDNGEAFVSGDGGIGLMQITNTTGYDEERLKSDLQYNIDTGIDFLKKNFNRSDLPKVGDHNPKNLESWYFAVMAYNGTKSGNSPFYKATGDRNELAYQEKVYREIDKMKATNIHSINMSRDDFHYGEDTNHTIKFLNKALKLSKPATPSNELLKVGNAVTQSGTRMRTKPTTQSTEITTALTAKFTIIGTPVYDEINQSNPFVWYPVKTVKDGKTITGYIASSNIKH